MSKNLADVALGIDHLAVAVRDLEAALIWFTEVVGFTLKERRRTEGKNTGMISAVLEAGPLQIVLLQGTSDESQVSRFVAEYGQGVQHIALRVEGLADLRSRLETAGLQFDTGLIEGGGLTQTFTKRDPRTGLMIEFIERRSGGFAEQNIAALFEQLESKDSY